MLYQLSYARIKILVENTKSFGPGQGKHGYPGHTILLYWSSKHGAPLPRLESPRLYILILITAGLHPVYNCPFSATFRVTNTCSYEMRVCPVLSTNNTI